MIRIVSDFIQQHSEIISVLKKTAGVCVLRTFCGILIIEKADTLTGV